MKEAAGGEGFVRENCILELRKEKSRDAARSRRGKENYEFYELAKMLPLPSAITSQLDKASIIRLTISYLKLREFSSHGDPSWNQNPSSSAKSIKGGHGRTRMTTIALEIFEQHQGTHILQSLDGFAFALAADGRFLYISETVSIYLGLSQVELTGSSVFDYIHQQDHAELAEQLGINLNQGRSIPSPTLAPSDDGPSSPVALMNVTNSVYEGLDRAFCIRMKSTLTKRGCHFKSSGYRVVLVLCHLRPQYSFSHSRKQPPTIMGMVALAIALPPPSVNEVRLESDMFVTRLTFDFKIAHCEPRVAELLDYTAEELTGKNMYALCHCEDLPKLRKCHIDLINKGQVMSSYYRAINKNAGYTWIQTCATVVSNSKNSEDRSIICVNYVLSGAEHEHCIMDCSQMGGHIQNLKPPDDPSNDFPESSSPDNDDKGDSDRRDGESSAGSPQHDDDGPSESSERLSQLSRQATVRPLVASSHGIGSSDMKDTNGGPMPKDSRPVEPESSEGKVSNIPNARKRRRQQKDEVCRDGPEEEAEQMIAATTDHSLPRPVDEQSSAGDSTTDGGNSSPSIAPRTLSPADCDDGKDCDGRGSVASGDGSVGSSRGWKFSGSHESGGGGGGGGGGSFVDDVTNSSVKELEDAMNKHLPIAEKDTGDGSALNGGKQSRHQQRSTIQWIGPQHASPVAVGTSPLPASTLLRQLYANRESVIRSNVHASRPAFFPTDLQGTLATSPGGEGSFSDQTQFVLPPKLTPHSSHSSDSYAAAILSASYSPSSTLPGATYGDSYDSSTPPSSSSPRDKLHPAGGGGGFPESQGYGDVRHFSSSGADSSHLQSLPLKPQVYTVHPGAVPGLEPVPFSTHAQQTLSGDHAQQFYAHPHASGFHIYHPSVNKIPNAPASYVDNLKNGSGWYPPANS